MIEFNRGIRIIGTDLWLDSTKARPLGFISHAHGDHTAKHQRIIATPATWSLCRRRLGAKPRTLPLAFRTPHSVDGFTIELLPSGHILGAAQIVIQNGRRIVYTGDFKLRPNRTADPAEVPPCDILIMECTFGKPRYVFPPPEEVERRLIAFIETAFEDRKIPVLLVYAMGKSQEVLKLLGDRGYTVCLSQPAVEIVKIYENCGVAFKNYERFSNDNLHGKVVLLPPYLARTRMAEKISNRRTAVLTGWAMDAEATSRYGADVAIPMSDHADFEELNEYVDRARPSKIYTVHGAPDFARHLRKRGYRAEHLAPGTQLELW
ncbi:MAG TPA: MBL fold metallo-hydrolase [Nitrospiria bacterium]|nr:MBL fold metallo-hydrolase [Nitrospiria bacterium]